MIAKKWEGRTTECFVVQVDRELIRRYANIIGDDHPIYHEVDVARAKGYPDLVAPSAMPIIFWQHAHVPWLINKGPILHREQTFTYREPLFAGRSYLCQIKLKKIEDKKHIQYLEHVLMGWSETGNANSPLFTATSILILKERV